MEEWHTLEVKQIELKHISVDPDQPRKHHSEESLQGLADSIRQHGMLNPITVTQSDVEDRYKIVTGERRWRAAGMARLGEIPCIVKQIDDDERLTEQLIENLQREDLQPLEKGKAIQYVKSSLNLTNREIAKRLGLSERTVGYLIDLLALPEDIGEAVVSRPNRPADGQLTETHARYLKQLNEEPQLQSAVVDRIQKDRLSSEDTSNLVRALKKRPGQAKEIMDTPLDHLDQFFNENPAALETFLDGIQEGDGSPRPSAHAQRILDFIPALSGMHIERLAHPELRQIEDALTSLKLAIDGMLSGCKQQLER